MSGAATQTAQLEFLTKLQRILGEGLFVASYKYALLLALAELSVEGSIQPDGTLPIELDDLADRFITLYWRQVAPFGGKKMLTQNTGRQASIIGKIATFKAQAPTLAVARNKAAWSRLVRDVGRLLNLMPLWRLQLVGKERLDFLYEERLVDRGIVLRPGIAACFRAQFGVVQALVQTAWLSFVQRLPLNRPILGSTTDLSDFLFGSERSVRWETSREGCSSSNRERASIAVTGFVMLERWTTSYHGRATPSISVTTSYWHMPLATRTSATCWRLLDIWRGGSSATTRIQPIWRKVFDSARFPFDADASLSVAEWAYESAERSGALVWVRCRGETSRLTAAWRNCLQ